MAAVLRALVGRVYCAPVLEVRPKLGTVIVIKFFVQPYLAPAPSKSKFAYLMFTSSLTPL